MSEKAKQKRVCGLCGKSGHNARTCSMNPKVKAKAAGAKAPSAPPVAATMAALVPVPTTLSAAEERDFGAIEFEEAVRQVRVNGTSLRMSCREPLDAGTADFLVRIQKDVMGAQNLQLDVEEASKLYELLGWGLQRQAARAKALPPARPNGKPIAEAR